jgi:hypothetical protein
VSLPQIFLMPANYFKNYQDPTALSIPIVATNGERGLFRLMSKFQFADGAQFDFRGDAERSEGSRSGTLSNSNERAGKGFTTTFSFKRDFKGLVGRMRLDWIMVKPPALIGHGRLFEPHFGRTLAAVNAAVTDQITDHHPIVVDLPLTTGPAVSDFVKQGQTTASVPGSTPR